jgi:hypothetical protein
VGEEILTKTVSTEVALDLARPETRLRVRIPGGTAGRAEARFGTQSWAAKHYWQEGEPGDESMVYEFDGPIPAGRVLLVVPVTSET